MRKRVTMHAKKRCHERFGVSVKRVKEIMLSGYPPVCFVPPFYDYLKWIKNRTFGAIGVKVKDGMIVIYNERSQKAITVYEVPEKYEPWDSYLIPAFKKAREDVKDNES